MKDGFWANYETGEIFPIDEHELWLRRGNNANLLGIPENISERFGEFTARADRDSFLLFIFSNAPVMRIRCHGAYATFEFNSKDSANSFRLIRQWCASYAGPQTGLNIFNFASAEHIQTNSHDFLKQNSCD